MKSRRKILGLLLVPLLVGVLSEPAWAKKKKRQNNQSGAQECADPNGCRGYGDYLDELQNQHPGSQFLDGDEINGGDGPRYIYRLLDPDGRVREFEVDPRNDRWFESQ